MKWTKEQLAEKYKLLGKSIVNGNGKIIETYPSVELAEKRLEFINKMQKESNES